MKYYAGIGSRNTPPDIQNHMFEVAGLLSNDNWILRSGGAEGADTAFEANATKKEIFLPWNGFNDRYIDNISYFAPSASQESVDLVLDLHPQGKYLKAAAFKLMLRNNNQVLGKNLDSPVQVVLCYTTDGKDSGGTGQAIRVAHAYNIPVINFFYPERVHAWLTANIL